MAVNTHHYFFESFLDLCKGITAFTETQREDGFSEVQVGPLDVQLASMLGLFVRATLPEQLQAFRDKAEALMSKRKIGFSGRPWVAAR